MSPTHALPPEVAAAAAPPAVDAVEVPAPDVLDVDFSRGTADDQAQGFAATAMDGVALVDDPELGQKVATFDGVDDAFRYHDFAKSWTEAGYVRPTTQMTMQCKFKYTGPVPPTGNVAMVCGNNGGSFMAYIQGSNLVTNIRQGASNWMNSAFAAGRWVDVVITYDGATMATYIDGDPVTRLARTGPVAVPAAGPARGFTLGDSLAPGSEAFDFTGQIASARVWSRALTPEQVKSLSGTEDGPSGPQQPEEPDEPGIAPRPNVFDVDFGRGTADDGAQGFAATAVDDVSLLEDPELGQTVASFDGDKDAYHYDDFADIWTSSGYARPTTSFTQQCKFRYTGASLPTQPQLICRVHGTGGFGMWVNGTTLTSALRLTTSNDWLASRYERHQWVDAVQTYDGATWKVYLDGELAVTKERTGQVLTPAPVDRAYTMADWPGGSGTRNFEGDIAASRVWTRALSAEQVRHLHEGRVKGPEVTQPRLVPEPAVLDVDFSRGTATDAAQGFTATPIDGVSIVADPELGQTVARFDGDKDAYHYDGFAQVWTDATKVRPTNAFTQQCKFKYTGASLPTQATLICRVHGTGGFGMWVNGTTLTSALRLTTSNDWMGGAYVPGEWVDAVQTYDGATWRLYVDGELVSSAARSGDVLVPAAVDRPFTLGDWPGGATPNFTGDIAASRVWNTALTPFQVKALHEGTVELPTVAVLETTPARGDHVDEAVAFEVRRQNAQAATAWSYQLDGEPIQPGDLIGPGLAAGAHEIVIRAVDPLGVNRMWRVPFRSEVVPVGGGADAHQGDGKVTLSAIASNAAGGQVTTTFSEALVTSASSGFQGVVDAPPATLEFDYREGSEVVGAQTPDGELVTSPTTNRRSLVFQRFDVAVPASDATRQVVWSGTVDPARSVTLLAWHDSRQEWVELATARGETDGETLLKGLVRPGFVDRGSVHLMVLGQDPFADDLAPRDASAGLPENRDHFEDPEDYDFSFAHFTDTQYLSQMAGGVCPSYFPGAEKVAREAYADLTSWISESAGSRKIAYAAHTGDLIESNMPVYYRQCAENEDQVAAEMAFASEMQATLDDSGVPTSVLAGNHDNVSGTESGPGTPFNQTFGPDRYYEAARSWPEGASYHPWDEVLDESGDVVTPGQDNDNNYVLFSKGGLDFVAVSLSYGVTNAEADWASSVFERYSERSGILLTHAYLSASSMPDGRSSGRSGDGGTLYSRVVESNPNVFLVLSGHIHGVATNVLPDSGVTVDREHGVVELLADYQEYMVPAGEVWPDKVGAGGMVDLDDDGVADYGAGDGILMGASFLRLLQIDIESSTMSVDTYSPHFDNFGATEYDTVGRYSGAEDNFTVPLDLPTRTTSFATDGLSVVTTTDTVIGEQTVASGWPATVEWTGLTEGELYGWTSTSRDASGATLGTVQQFGGVIVASAAGTDVTAPVLTVPPATQVQVGDAFDPLEGVTAVDATDGDLRDRVQVVGVVDALTAGTYPLLYSVSDANGNTAQAVQVVTVVAAPEPESAATTVQAGNVTTVAGGTATLRATVMPTAATGTVRFLDGETLLCEAVIVDGAATCVPSELPAAGSYSIDAVYSGDETFKASRRSFVLTVGERSVTVTSPTVAGTAKVGGTLTARTGTRTDGATLTYQWLRDGKPVPGARGRAYTAVAADAGTRVSVEVTGSKEGYLSSSETSPSVTVRKGTLIAPKPRIVGEPRVGRKLTAVPGTWSAGTRLTYQWYANGKKLAAARGRVFRPTRGLVGKRIVVKVTGTKAGYTTVVKTSRASKVKRRR